MTMNLLHRVTALIVALVSASAIMSSCVQHEYEISEDNLNLDVTLFQDGMQIPLASTGQMNMTDLMESLGQAESAEYLSASGENGEYFFEMSQMLDLTEYLTESGEMQSEPVVKYIDLNTVRDAFDFGSSDAALKDARLCVDFQTNIGTASVVDLTITPFYGDEQAEPITRRLEIQPSESIDEMNHTRYWLGSNPECAKDEYVFVDFPVQDLLKELPDMIKISMITAGSDTKCVTKGAEGYRLEADCTFEVPLVLDETASISFSYTIDNLQEVLQKIFEEGDLIFIGTVINSFPLNIEMNAELLDQNGDAIKINGANITIKAGTVQTPVTTDFKFSFEKNDIGEFKTISGVRFDIKATGVDGAVVTPESTLEIKLQTYVPEGVPLDLKDLLKAQSNNENE
jgi:hypothetical protein